MAKDINNPVEFLDLRNLDGHYVDQLLSEGKTLIFAYRKGMMVKGWIKKGYNKWIKANIEVKEERENCGTCYCKKPANVLVYVWRD